MGQCLESTKEKKTLTENAFSKTLKSREIFSVTVVGEELYIAASADDVNSIYKDTKNLDFDAVIVDLLREFSISRDTLDKLFDAQLSGGRSWMDRQHDVYREQMHPVGRGNALAETVLQEVEKAVQWDHVLPPIALDSPSETSRKVSLWKWCAHALVEASMQAFFGPSFLCLSPEFVADYLKFDEDYWRLKAKSPKAAATTKENCVSALSRWLDLPEMERRDACWMVTKVEHEFVSMGICDKSQLAALLFINIEVYVFSWICTALHTPPPPQLALVFSQMPSCATVDISKQSSSQDQRKCVQELLLAIGPYSS